MILLSSGSDVDAQPLTITHLAGSDGGFGWFDGTGSADAAETALPALEQLQPLPLFG